MRWAAWVVLVVVLLLTLGCKASRELGAAKEAHGAGELGKALEHLAAARNADPTSKAALEAQKLAPEWLIAAADEAVASDKKLAYLREALTWDPKSGSAQIRICELHAKDQSWEPLRTCLDKDLAGKSPPPPEVLGRAKDALAIHDREVAEAVERATWLASSEARDWQSIVEKYPSSIEATTARAKLLRHGSICVDLDQFLPVLRAEHDRMLGLLLAFKTASNKNLAYLKLSTTAKDRAKAMQDLAARARAHIVKDDEQAAQSGLAIMAETFQNANHIFYNELKDKHGDAEDKVVHTLTALVDFDSAVHSTAKRTVQSLDLLDSNCSLTLSMRKLATGANAVPAPAVAASSESTAPAGSVAPDKAIIASLWEGVTVTAVAGNDGTSASAPSLAPDDVGFVDTRNGWGWGDRCWVNIKRKRWGHAKAECIKGLQGNPASPNPKASLLYNLGLVEKGGGSLKNARALFQASLVVREHPEVRAALDALPP